MNDNKSPIKVAVLGAGVSGILSGIKLQQAGIDSFTIYEQSDSIGGTWRDNTYPGLECDVPSHLYSFSFELNPDWSRLYAPGPEIYAYLQAVVGKYGLERHMRLSTKVVRLELLDDGWMVEDEHGGRDTYDVVIAATGVLVHPVYPDFEGMSSFEGQVMHSARWDHQVPIDGRQVAVIGGGSSGIQIVAALASRVSRMTHLQRTPQWVLPLENPPYTEEQQRLFREDKVSLQREYKELSQKFDSTFALAVIGDRTEQEVIRKTCLASLATIRDPELRRKLTPDYTVGCKRIVVSAGYYKALQQPNARLINTRIERIEPKGVRTADGEMHPCDLLALATGFHAHQYMRPMQLVGADGVTLDEAWAEENLTYRSVSIPKFPNLFVVLGPHSPFANHSIMDVAEIQVRYIVQLVKLIAQGKCRRIVARREAAARFQQALREKMPETVWVMGCSSWYQDQRGNPTVWPWDMSRYRNEMRRPNLDDFELD